MAVDGQILTSSAFPPINRNPIQNHFLAGCRNGSVKLFDVRSKSSGNGKDILGSKFQKKQHSSVYALKMINEWQLLVATLSGDVRNSREPRYLFQTNALQLLIVRTI